MSTARTDCESKACETEQKKEKRRALYVMKITELGNLFVRLFVPGLLFVPGFNGLKQGITL